MATCGQCQGEIYPGEEFYRVDGEVVCLDCLKQWAREYFHLYREGGED